jgi:hypothetical protein
MSIADLANKIDTGRLRQSRSSRVIDIRGKDRRRGHKVESSSSAGLALLSTTVTQIRLSRNAGVLTFSALTVAADDRRED